MSDTTPTTPARASAPLALGAKIAIWPPVVLAPMAGVTNFPYRTICREFGAGLCVSEMVSARGILAGGEKTWKLAAFGADERPRSIQLFGCDPASMGEAARVLRGELDVDHIDINFGCPVRKVTRKGMGAAAFLDRENARRVVRAVVRAIAPLPVTIKVRVGMDDDRVTFRDAGRAAEDEGCAWIALHGRTAAQMYSGRARWDVIGELKGLVSIPVLGNGDVFSAPDARRMIEITGCDGVVIGRGCLGNPWLFSDLRRVFGEGGPLVRPTVEEIAGVIRRHYRLLVEDNRAYPRLAVLQLRKFGTWYVRGLRGSTGLRTRFQAIENEEDLEAILADIRAARFEAGAPDPALATA